MNIASIKSVNSVKSFNTKNIGFCSDLKNINNGDVIDCNELYSKEDVKSILETIGTYPKLPALYSLSQPDFDVKYYSSSGSLVFNCKNMTNNTTIIEKDGKAISKGSWHHNEVAPSGTYTYLIEDAQKRIANKK